MENTIEDFKTIELRIEQTKLCSLYGNEWNNPMITDIDVIIEEWDHINSVNEKEIGKISLSLINMGMAINKNYEPIKHCMDHSDYLGTISSLFYDDYDFKDKITNVLDTPMGSDMLVITEILLVKEYHGKNIIEDSLKMIIEQYGYVPMVGFKSGEFEYDQADYESIGFKKIKTKVGYVYGLNNELVNF